MASYVLTYSGTVIESDGSHQNFDVYRQDGCSLVYEGNVAYVGAGVVQALRALQNQYPLISNICDEFGSKVRIIDDAELLNAGRYGTLDASEVTLSSGQTGASRGRDIVKLATTSLDNGGSRTDYEYHHFFDFGYVREWGYDYYQDGQIKTYYHDHDVIVQRDPTDCCLRFLCYPNDYFLRS